MVPVMQPISFEKLKKVELPLPLSLTYSVIEFLYH
jgi:hypothetical protein